MIGHSGSAPRADADDREVDPAMPRRLFHLARLPGIFAALVTVVYFVPTGLGGSLSHYLTDRPVVTWLLVVLLFASLWAYLAGQEFGRRDEATRTSARRTARAARPVPAAPRPTCRRCAVTRDENAALRGEIEALKREAETLRAALAPAPPSGPAGHHVWGPT